MNKEYLELKSLVDLLPFAKDKVYELSKRKQNPFPESRIIAGKVVWKRAEVQTWLDKEWDSAA